MAAVCVFCASSRVLEPHWLDLGYQVGTALATRGHQVISGGGCVGMMGTLAEGARAAGGHTIGVIPRSLLELEVGDQDADELLVTDGMAARKVLMMDKSDAFLTLPGGLGTLDELFEVWTTAALGLHRKPVVLLDHGGFYAELVRWLRGLVSAGFANADAVEDLIVVDSIPAALDAIEARLGRAPLAGSADV
ncbi:MAG: TIGR00730 family Rossman fold protein [Sporichthyaceae bacterium]|nr:TIGR00730 family Rossman fold protein [Sporichthyaceae bacterium]